MDKEELERELEKSEKAEKGCVITVINQSSLPLTLDGSRHHHGKFKARPPRTIVAKETASFSLEGRKSIEASVKFKWGKGRLELFWNMPEQGDPKIFYRVAPSLKNKLFVYIPTAVFGRITKFIFLVDEKPVTPITPQELSSTSNTDTNEDISSENISDGENDMSRNSNATPRSVNEEAKSTQDTNSFDFSSDEDDEPKTRINVVIKPKSETPVVDILATPVIAPVAPPAGGRRRANTKTQRDTVLFGDLNDQLFQQTVLSPGPTPPTNSPPRERRLSMSSDSGPRPTTNAMPNPRNSLPLDGLLSLDFSKNASPQLVAPPHLITPPLTPNTQNSSITASSFSFGALSPTPSVAATSPSSSPSPLKMSFEDIRSLSSFHSGPSGPSTPKPAHTTAEVALTPRSNVATSPINTPLTPAPSVPKSPPIISGAPTTNTAAIMVPQKVVSAGINIGASPTKPALGLTQQPYNLLPDTPARTAYAPMSPPLQRQPSAGRGLNNATPFDMDSPNSRQPGRRYSEPPPVDLNLLFPEIAAAKDKNKKPDIIAPAQKHMQAAMAHLEKNSIAAALGHLDLCLSVLATLPEETAQELEYCIRYRLFFVLLKEIAKPKPPIEHAFLSMFLSEIPVKPQHRVVAIRMAIRHNINSQNFGLAAGLIQFLIERVHPVDEAQLQEKLRKCASQGRSNSDPRFYKYCCPGCEATTGLIALKCALCQNPVKLCALTLEIINTKAYYSCKLCKLNFSRKSISPRDSELKCPFCKVGDLTNKVFVSNK